MFRIRSVDLYFWVKEDAIRVVELVKTIPSSQVKDPEEQRTPISAHEGVSRTSHTSPVVQQLEQMAITGPESKQGVPGHESAPSANSPRHSDVQAPAGIVQSRTQSPQQSVNYALEPYNPAAPAAPEPIRPREKTPPPPDAVYTRPWRKMLGISTRHLCCNISSRSLHLRRIWAISHRFQGLHSSNRRTLSEDHQPVRTKGPRHLLHPPLGHTLHHRKIRRSLLTRSMTQDSPWVTQIRRIRLQLHRTTLTIYRKVLKSQLLVLTRCLHRAAHLRPLQLPAQATRLAHRNTSLLWFPMDKNLLRHPMAPYRLRQRQERSTAVIGRNTRLRALNHIKTSINSNIQVQSLWLAANQDPSRVRIQIISMVNHSHRYHRAIRRQSIARSTSLLLPICLHKPSLLGRCLGPLSWRRELEDS